MPVSTRQSGSDADVILVGAGLWSAVVAARLSSLPAPPRIIILERSSTPFAGHTWSFHQSDVAAADMSWLDPMIAYRWQRQTVRFPAYSRTLDTGYGSLTFESVARYIESLPNVELRAEAQVERVEDDRVRLADGSELHSPCAIDASGFAPDPALKLGFQKFVGLEVETESPHGLVDPIIMDATVPQLDGYRFLYCLPFAPNRLLIEDTRYSDGPDVDAAELEAAVLEYASSQGWSVARIVKREQGALPITLAFDAEAFWSRKPKTVPQMGLKAALFHPVTGYSLPEAVAVANLIAEAWPTTSPRLADAIRSHAKRRAKRQGFYRLLNRMLFRAAAPDRRYLVLQRFYRLPQGLIESFYAGRTTKWQMLQILTGKPPVPLGRAIPCMSESGFLQREQQTA
ncbi:lycopene cyclase [Neorhizobium sp. SOG26]|uniref:lycopene beta-cyclase CrtY n=1 Tax=Neorhizobium sp. SOG26 TaxID=2060726 RepID=UPI000E588E36|nr:lycopene beta-cyclase CrtY [Neorhizobium sp. SOG26]AXV16405.1 lycopene cyclase [Neorhizobium sp. SOG26]